MYKKASDILENALVEKGALKEISESNKTVEKRVTDITFDRKGKKTIFTIEILGSEKKLKLYPSEIFQKFGGVTGFNEEDIFLIAFELGKEANNFP
jgi:hypothetical protein